MIYPTKTEPRAFDARTTNHAQCNNVCAGMRTRQDLAIFDRDDARVAVEDKAQLESLAVDQGPRDGRPVLRCTGSTMRLITRPYGRSCDALVAP